MNEEEKKEENKKNDPKGKTTALPNLAPFFVNNIM